jgi:hypothetical protein
LSVHSTEAVIEIDAPFSNPLRCGALAGVDRHRPIVGLLYGKLIAGYLNTEAQGLKKRSEASNPA